MTTTVQAAALDRLRVALGEPDPNPSAPRPEAGPTVCPDCRADVYPAATRADAARVCDRTPCHYLPPKLWRGS